MPEGFIQLPVDSTGKKLRTWEIGTQGHDQYVRLAQTRGTVPDIYASGSALITWTATASLRLWGIFNPAASGKTLYIRKISHNMVSTAAGVAVQVGLFRTTDTTTTGTAATPARLDSAAVANVAVVRSMPTAGTISGGPLASQVTPSGAAQSIYDEWFWDNGGFTASQLVVAQGTGLMISVVGTPDADMRSTVDCIWEEA